MSGQSLDQWVDAKVVWNNYPHGAVTTTDPDDGDEVGRGTHVFIQYKGTDICLDFNCSCGQQSHFDGYFAQVIRCAACGGTYDMPVLVALRRHEGEATL